MILRNYHWANVCVDICPMDIVYGGLSGWTFVLMEPLDLQDGGYRGLRIRLQNDPFYGQIVTRPHHDVLLVGL